VIIRWSTESEVDTLGFMIFRGENEEGPFDVQVNEEEITSLGQVVSGADYQIVDRNVIPGTTYYYQLQEIQLDGNLEMYGPIMNVAKRSGIVEMIFSVALLAALFIVGRKKMLTSREETEFERR
jgi:hypothetical protein